MVQRVNTVAFSGVDVQEVDVQVQISPGLPQFNIVGLPDKAVGESRERVRAAQDAEINDIRDPQVRQIVDGVNQSVAANVKNDHQVVHTGVVSFLPAPKYFSDFLK